MLDFQRDLCFELAEDYIEELVATKANAGAERGFTGKRSKDWENDFIHRLTGDHFPFCIETGENRSSSKGDKFVRRNCKICGKKTSN